MASLRAQTRIIPGFGIALGYTVLYLSLVVLIPLAVLLVRSTQMGWETFRSTVTSPEVLSAYWMSISASLLAAAVNVPLGLLIAWVLVRYDFWGRRVLDAVIDLPFALPTAVAGITLAQLYGSYGWIGRGVESSGLRYPWVVWRGFDHGSWPLGIAWFDRIARAPAGVMVALMFIGLPFVVRTIQPVLQDVNRELEEAAASLGASRWQTFRRVILPQVLPAMITGMALAFARGLGEYGSVVFIAGTNQKYTDIAPREIISLLDMWNYNGATAVAAVLLVLSLLMLLVINLLQRWMSRRAGEVA